MTRRELGIFALGIVIGCGLFYLRLQWIMQEARLDRIEGFLAQAFQR